MEGGGGEGFRAELLTIRPPWIGNPMGYQFGTKTQ